MTGEFCVSLDTVADVLIGLAALGLLTFSVIYTWKANWRRTPLGRHLFYFGWTFVFAYIVGVARQWYPELDWLDHVRLFSLTLVVVVVWQRVFLQLRALKRAESPDALHTPDDEKGRSDGRS